MKLEEGLRVGTNGKIVCFDGINEMVGIRNTIFHLNLHITCKGEGGRHSKHDKE